MPAENNPYRPPMHDGRDLAGEFRLNEQDRVAGVVRRAIAAGPMAAQPEPPQAPMLLSREAGLTAADIDAIARRNYAAGVTDTRIELDESRRREVGELVEQQAGIYDEGFDAGQQEGIEYVLRVMMAGLRPALVELAVAVDARTVKQARETAARAESIVSTVIGLAEADIEEADTELRADTLDGIRWLGELIRLVREHEHGADISERIAEILRPLDADADAAPDA